MKIIIGADSAGYVLKAPIKKFLEEKGIEWRSQGAMNPGWRFD